MMQREPHSKRYGNTTEQKDKSHHNATCAVVERFHSKQWRGWFVEVFACGSANLTTSRAKPTRICQRCSSKVDHSGDMLPAELRRVLRMTDFEEQEARNAGPYTYNRPPPAKRSHADDSPLSLSELREWADMTPTPLHQTRWAE